MGAAAAQQNAQIAQLAAMERTGRRGAAAAHTSELEEGCAKFRTEVGVLELQARYSRRPLKARSRSEPSLTNVAPAQAY